MARRKSRKSAYIPPQSETTNRKQRRPTTRGGSSGSGGARMQARVPNPPSWKRVFRQVPVYYLMIAGVNYLLTPGHDKAGHALKTMDRLQLSAGSSLLVVLAFVPLMYFLDRNRWTRYQASQGITPEPRAKGPKSGIVAR